MITRKNLTLGLLLGLAAIAISTTEAFAQAAPVPMARPKAVYWEKQPEMKAAIESMRETLRHLKKASGDKGGHRAAAIKQTRSAIREVWKGVAFDNKNLSAAELKALQEEQRTMEAQIDADLK